MQLTNATKYGTPAAAAKALKKELTRAFPGVKFSVKTKNYSMGNSISVHWNNGPTTKQVERFADKYQKGSFDGMQDLYTYEPTLIVDSADGQLKELGGAKYVHTSRSIYGDYKTEEAFGENVQRDLAKLQHMEYEGPLQKFYPNDPSGTGCLQDAAWRVISRIDFTKGNYAGLRWLTDAEREAGYSPEREPVVAIQVAEGVR